MSDVGGTAGLILGMSFATIVGLIDIFIQYAIRMIWLPFEKAKDFFKALDWDFKMCSRIFDSFVLNLKRLAFKKSPIETLHMILSMVAHFTACESSDVTCRAVSAAVDVSNSFNNPKNIQDFNLVVITLSIRKSFLVKASPFFYRLLENII